MGVVYVPVALQEKLEPMGIPLLSILLSFMIPIVLGNVPYQGSSETAVAAPWIDFTSFPTTGEIHIHFWIIIAANCKINMVQK